MDNRTSHRPSRLTGTRSLRQNAHMSNAALQTTIDRAWEARDELNAGTRGEVRDAVEAALALLDRGAARVATKTDGVWTVHQWLKRPSCFPSGSMTWV
jgi:hypothetical protein